MILIRLALRNATRNGTRTILTAVTVVLGTALLTVALTWANGVFGQITGVAAAAAGHVRIVRPAYAEREVLMPLYENLEDVAPILEAALGAPGVVAAYPRIGTGVTLGVGEDVGDVFGLVLGAPDAYFLERLRVEDDLVAGRWRRAEGEAVLGVTLASQAGAGLGDRVLMLGQTQDGALSPIEVTVVGILGAGNALLDQQAYVSLAQARWLTDIPDGAVEVLVFGADRDRAPRLAASLRERFPDLTVEAWSEREPWAGLLTVAGVVRALLQGAVVLVTALGVWNTMTLSVLERTNEIGVMRAMGLTRAGAVGLFVTEAVAIAVLGGLGGVLLGGLGGYWLEVRGIRLGDRVVQNLGGQVPFQSTMYGDLDLGVLLTAFLLGVCTAFVGSAAPAFRAAAIQPVVAMRERR